MPTVFPSASVPAGTPIILAPRMPQLSSVTSSLPSATTMLTCPRPPSVGSAADPAAVVTGSVIYPIDPYVQQVLEYSTGLQRSPTGCILLVISISTFPQNFSEIYKFILRILRIFCISCFQTSYSRCLWHANQMCSDFLSSV